MKRRRNNSKGREGRLDVTGARVGGSGKRGSSGERLSKASRRDFADRMRASGERLMLSSESRREAKEQAEVRKKERSDALHAREFAISDKRAIITPSGVDWGAIPGRLGRFFANIFERLSVSRELVVRIVITGALLVFFSLMQTTLFTRLPPFGAVPDLMLCFCIAIAVTEGEHFGSVNALFAALVITALGSVSVDPAPVLYLICAYTSGVLCRYVLKQNVLIRAMFTLAAGVLRGAATLAAIAVASPTYTFAAAWKQAIFPEFLSTIICAPFVHLIVWLALLAFHRSRAQRTGEN